MSVTVKYDKDIFDDARQYLYDEVKKELIAQGKQAMREAPSIKKYQNQTWDLVNAYGFGVVMFGELVHIEVPADSAHHHVIAETTKTIQEVASGIEGIALILANGKEYASFVEKKGYDVLTQTNLNTVQRLQK